MKWTFVISVKIAMLSLIVSVEASLRVWTKIPGEKVNLWCNFPRKTLPRGMYYWKKGERNLADSSRPTRYIIEHSLQGNEMGRYSASYSNGYFPLNIRNVGYEDVERYTCFNANSRAIIREHFLFIANKMACNIFNNGPVFEIGDNVNLWCSYNKPPEINTTETFQLCWDGKDCVNYTGREVPLSLTINKKTFKETVKCKLKLAAYQEQLDLCQVRLLPNITITGQIIGRVGEYLTLNCRSQGQQIRWSSNIISLTEQYVRNKTLIIPNIKKEYNDAVITCSVGPFGDERPVNTSDSVVLVVKENPSTRSITTEGTSENELTDRQRKDKSLDLMLIIFIFIGGFMVFMLIVTIVYIYIRKTRLQTYKREVISSHVSYVYNGGHTPNGDNEQDETNGAYIKVNKSVNPNARKILSLAIYEEVGPAPSLQEIKTNGGEIKASKDEGMYIEMHN